MGIDKSKITPEMIQKAAACKNADELMALAKELGYEITKDEAEAYLEELSGDELNPDALESVAGGTRYCYMIDGCQMKCGTICPKDDGSGFPND